MNFSKKNPIKILKTLILISIIITFASIILNVSNSLKTLKTYKESQIELGKFIMTSIKSGNRIFAMTHNFQNSKMKEFIELLSKSKAIERLVIYRNNTTLLYFGNKHKFEFKSDFYKKGFAETDNYFHFYSEIKNIPTRRMYGNPFMNKENYKNLKIILTISKKEYNALKQNVIIDFIQIAIIQLLLFSIFIYTLKLIKMYEKSRQQLLKAQKEAELSKYSGILAHEIKNPLSSIKGLTEYVKGQINDEKSVEHLNKASEEIERLNKIVNDFLQFGKEISLNLQECFVDEILAKALELTKYEAVSKRIQIDRQIEQVAIKADKDKLLQVFLNLIFNAIQGAPENSNIHIVLNDSFLSIKNENENTNIDKNKIFEPFYTTKTKGTGLGLAISKKILDLHKFKIDVTMVKPFIVKIFFNSDNTN